MKAVLWIGACLALAGALGTAAGTRLLHGISPLPSKGPAPSPTVPDLAQITNPQPEILHYPNAPGYPPDLAPDPDFMDLPSYAPAPGLDWADNVVDTTVEEMGLEPKGLPLAPDEAWVGVWEYVKYNTTAPGAAPALAPSHAAVTGLPSPGAVSAFSLNG